jgi:hypothetical protein
MMKGNLQWLEGNYLESGGQNLLQVSGPVFALKNSDKPGGPQDTTSGKWTEVQRERS